MSDLLSRVGIGSATVDTKVPSTVTAGDTVEATVETEGGSSEQEVEAIYFALETRYETEDSSATAVIDRYQLTDPFTVSPDEHLTKHTELTVPRTTPITVGRTQVWIETGLDIDWALDRDDTDYISVEPTARMQRVFDAVERLGFSLNTARPEAKPGGVFSSGVPFVQEFEYRPRGGPFRGDIDEVELVFAPEADALDVRLEVDRRTNFLAEMSDVDFDERYDSVTVRDQSVDELESTFHTVIERNS